MSRAPSLPSGSRARLRAAEACLILLVAWGALAFGAVYPWAYWPLAAGALMTVALAPHAESRPVPVGLIAAIAGFLAGVGAQLIPLPLEVLARWFPETLRAIQQLDLQVAGGVATSHPLTLDPMRTTRGVTLLVADIAVLIASARICSIKGPRSVAEKLTTIGVILALVGIIQKPLFTGKIYGFWSPYQPSVVFGPFVNRNHFAGWMLMALPLTIALIAERASRGAIEGITTWRSRVLWLASSDANRVVLLVAASLVMAFALVLTTSRSGIVAFGCAVSLAGLVVLRFERGTARYLLIVYLVLLVALATAGVGSDVILNRFSGTDDDDVNARLGAWADASAITAQFPLAGTGFNTYGVATLLYQRHDLALHYNAAHNDYLQLAAEGGWLLGIPACITLVVFIVSLTRRFVDEMSRSSYWLRAGAVTGLVAIGLQEAVDFSLQIPGNAALCAVLCGIALHRRERPPRAAPHVGTVQGTS